MKKKQTLYTCPDCGSQKYETIGVFCMDGGLFEFKCNKGHYFTDKRANDAAKVPT